MYTVTLLKDCLFPNNTFQLIQMAKLFNKKNLVSIFYQFIIQNILLLCDSNTVHYYIA